MIFIVKIMKFSLDIMNFNLKIMKINLGIMILVLKHSFNLSYLLELRNKLQGERENHFFTFSSVMWFIEKSAGYRYIMESLPIQ